MPTDLITMQASLKLFDKLMAEIPKREEEFPKILEQYQTLGIRNYLLLLFLIYNNILQFLFIL